jgi:hypothetical protein
MVSATRFPGRYGDPPTLLILDWSRADHSIGHQVYRRESIINA